MNRTRKKDKVLQTNEGRILAFGLLMSLVLLVIICFFAFSNREFSKAMLLVLLAHTFGGRAAGISICILNDMSFFWTLVYNFYLEVLIVCYTYSLFVLALGNYIKLRGLKLMALKLGRKARVHKEKIRSYGWIGLFLFVMAPLPVTGPVIGSIIGFLLRFRLIKNFSAVFLGTLAAIGIWTLFFDFLEQHLHVIRYVIGGIVVLIFLSYARSIKNWLAEKVQSTSEKTT